MQRMQRITSAMPWMNSRTPVTGISAFSGKTGMPAGLKMLSSLNWIDILAKIQPAQMKATTAGKKKMKYRIRSTVARTEERRVGKECGSKGRSRWAPDHKK